MRSSWIVHMIPNPTIIVPIRDTDKSGEGHVNTVQRLERCSRKECLEPPEASEEARKDSPLEPPE